MSVLILPEIKLKQYSTNHLNSFLLLGLHRSLPPPKLIFYFSFILLSVSKTLSFGRIRSLDQASAERPRSRFSHFLFRDRPGETWSGPRRAHKNIVETETNLLNFFERRFLNLSGHQYFINNDMDSFKIENHI